MDQDRLPTISSQQTENSFDSLRNQVVEALDAFGREQTKINRAFFAALSPEQRDKFAQACAEQDMKPRQIQSHTGKSQPTISRHLNGRNT